VVARLGGQGRADEAVTLSLRDELACRLRLRVERDVDVDLDVHECMPAVRVALRHLTARLGAPLDLDSVASSVVVEARQDAAGETGEDEMLGRPRLLLRER
jgi:hypothetical protein